KVHELESARHAEARHRMAGGRGDVDAAYSNRTARGRQRPGDEIEEGRLARAVGPDDAADLLTRDVERDVPDRVDPAERFAQLRQLQDGRTHGWRFRVRRSTTPSIQPPIPCGANRATATMRPPTSSTVRSLAKPS